MSLSPKSKSILKTIGNFVSTFITVIVAVIAIAFVVIKLLGWNMYTVESASMTPKLPVNSVVVVQKIDPEQIKEGDIITYILNENNVLVTHRVVAVDSQNQTFTTKGDANNSADSSPVRWGNVVGKATFCIPAIGTPVRFLTNPANRPYVIAVIGVLLILSIVWDCTVKKKDKKSKESETSVNETSDKEQQSISSSANDVK